MAEVDKTPVHFFDKHVLRSTVVQTPKTFLKGTHKSLKKTDVEAGNTFYSDLEPHYSSVVHGCTLSASPWSWFEMQNLRFHLRFMNQKLHGSKNSR